MPNRREFLATSAALAFAARAGSDIQQADDPLEILFLGGTGFIGPHQINYALDRGHRVSMFNRGRREGLFGNQVEELIGNRDSNIDEGLKALQGKRTWDVVVDNSGYIPRHVRDSIDLLKERCGRYIYISTVAVYDFDAARGDIGADSPLLPAPTPTTEEVNGRTYGPLKAECDRIAQRLLGHKLTSVRPTYVIGPGDTSDRFTYWVDRVHRGGDVVCPALPDEPATWIDVRDLSRWVLHLAENDTSGLYNGVAPDVAFTRRQLMHGIQATTASGSRLHWPSAEQLAAAGFDAPMFPPEGRGVMFESGPAKSSGLDIRPVSESIVDIRDWWQSLPAERRANPRRWPTPDQEAQVLKALDNNA